MELRRPIAVLFTALALFGGGAGTLTACGGQSNDGTTDDSGGEVCEEDNSEEQCGDLPSLTDPELEQNEDDDTIPPD